MYFHFFGNYADQDMSEVTYMTIASEAFHYKMVNCKERLVFNTLIYQDYFGFLTHL